MASPSNKKILIITVTIAIVVIMLLWIVLAYNNVVGKEQDVNSASSLIKNRYTTKVNILGQLLPQVDAYKVYESSLITNLTMLQTQWQQALNQGADDETLINISSQIDTNFILVLSTWTNYPQLEADELVSQYMAEVVDLEEQLSYARSVYNDAVRNYNTSIRSFPTMLFAGMWGFEERPYWGSELPDDSLGL
ncbi:MAG: LemA family protein [Methanomassiliicoccales archaeon]|nr:MAG: LemA family protein [Methanomassiliicoccales archaeon]